MMKLMLWLSSHHIIKRTYIFSLFTSNSNRWILEYKYQNTKISKNQINNNLKFDYMNDEWYWIFFIHLHQTIFRREKEIHTLTTTIDKPTELIQNKQKIQQKYQFRNDFDFVIKPQRSAQLISMSSFGIELTFLFLNRNLDSIWQFSLS